MQICLQNSKLSFSEVIYWKLATGDEHIVQTVEQDKAANIQLVTSSLHFVIKRIKCFNN